jgi:hypothetical protein
MVALLREKFASFFAPLLPLLVSERLSCMFVSSRLSIPDPDSSGRMYNDNVATSKDREAYVAGQPLFYGKPNPQAAKVTASQQSNQPTFYRTSLDLSDSGVLLH